MQLGIAPSGNEELSMSGIKGRVVIVGGVGRRLISNSRRVAVIGGLVKCPSNAYF